MSQHFFLVAVTPILLFFSCGNAGGTAPEPVAEGNNQGAVIVGEWLQQFSSLDKNSNSQLDPEERKSLGSMLGYDWFRFNADGTCVYDKDVKFKGNYEIVETKNKKKVTIRTKAGERAAGYTVTSVSKDELVLSDNGAFMVFKRVN